MAGPRTTYATLTAGNQPASLFDQSFNDTALLGTTPCSASGNNAITLTPIGFTASISAYANNPLLLLSFIAVGTSTGNVTIGLTGLSLLNLYLPGGVTQAGSGNITTGNLYIIAYNAALNSNAGGFVILNTSSLTATTIIPNYRSGMVISNDSSSPNSVIDVAAGTVADSTNAVMIVLPSVFKKSTAGAWSAGSGADGMGNGLTIAINTWYHVFIIINNASVDAYFDTSPSAANAPSGTTAFRRIGSFKTDGSANILLFLQTGWHFDLGAPINERNNTATGVTTAVTQQLNGSPTGVVVRAYLSGLMIDPVAADAIGYISSFGVEDVVPGIAAITAISAGNAPGGFALAVATNTSAQVRIRTQTTTLQLLITTNGWDDFLGDS